MGKKRQENSNIAFFVDKANLYRDEAITDLKSASIRKLTPINLDGTVDESRRPMFFGHAELISPQGPVPVQAELTGTDTLEAAIEALPAAMEKAAEEVRANYNKMMEEQQTQQQQQSKVIKSGDQ
jgi:hypothetical protein